MGELTYQTGFANFFATEAAPGSLPVGQNNPQQAPHGLYAEQLSGSAFTAPNADNQRTWLYRILPSVVQSPFRLLPSPRLARSPFAVGATPPDQLRWDPLPLPTTPTDFIDGLVTICGNGDPGERSGCAVHIYSANQSMSERCFYNADGDLLIVPEHGTLRLVTECGLLDVGPEEVAVVQRGIKLQVQLQGPTARGYVCENFGERWQLPQRGVIGANGLANSRDFLTPVAWYEDKAQPMQLVTKYDGHLWSADLQRSPFDVVAWHGNYAPFKYDLRLFNTIGSISFDHPDPSIFTVLTSPGLRAGTANVDFVIFPPRWMVAEHTFRPPYFHRNVMSEYMGLVRGVYDAKPGGGFDPGGGSLHNCMSAHGPEAAAFEAASKAELKPTYLGNTLAFMFESGQILKPTPFALQTPAKQADYLGCWRGLKPHFKAPS